MSAAAPGHSGRGGGHRRARRNGVNKASGGPLRLPGWPR
eukprot:CAMPEP_0176303414 /NCGR_PEP_ID=MMETSP0121_2-20121125/61894_1 /TAXON_ID=160619 /ORGANISM="Kryptoperidinium foliaceum, Strain CCMP 1326" /LENGTH=38 /DNA_ID= /DNA_START= /DNA_END= /DNA_ORIENTATION=